MTWRIELADVLWDVADDAVACQNYDRALTLFLEAEGIYRALAEEPVSRALRDRRAPAIASVGGTLVRIGRILATQKKTIPARATLEEGIALLQRVSGTASFEARRDIADASKLLVELQP